MAMDIHAENGNLDCGENAVNGVLFIYMVEDTPADPNDCGLAIKAIVSANHDATGVHGVGDIEVVQARRLWQNADDEYIEGYQIPQEYLPASRIAVAQYLLQQVRYS